MAHSVICKICNNTFNRDIEPYVKVDSRRYAHSECYLQSCRQNNVQPTLEIVNPNDYVTCKYCKQKFNKNETAFVQVSEKYFAHSICAEREAKRPRTEEEQLKDYICEQIHQDYVPPLIQKQIKEYIEKYNYSYSGILKALKYIINNKSISIQWGTGIAIVPYYYQDAYDYYYKIWNANQSNKEKDIYKYKPSTKQIKIKLPTRQPIETDLFSFLN